MPAPILAGLGRSVAAAAQAAARVATTVAQGVGRAAAAATQTGARAGGTAATTATRAAAGSTVAGAGSAGATAAAPSAAAAQGGRFTTAASQASQSARQGAFRHGARHEGTLGPVPPSPFQFLRNLAKDWWMEGASSAGSRGGGGGRRRQGRGRRRNSWSLYDDDDQEYGEQGEPVSRGRSGGSDSAGSSGTSLGMLRETMNRWERIQRGIGTVADLAITAHAAGNLTGGRSAAGAVGAIARRGAGMVGNTLNAAGSPIGALNAGMAPGLQGIVPSPTKIIVDFGFKMADAVKRLDEFGRGLVEARRPLADLDGRMAAATAQLDVDRVRRNIRLAKMTGETAKSQSETQSKFEDRMLPYQAALTNVLNTIVTLLQKAAMAADLFIRMTPLADAVLKKLAKEEEDRLKNENQTLIEFARKLSSGEFDKRQFEELPEVWGGKPKDK